jgi:plasmid stabilization system protein ParE
VKPVRFTPLAEADLVEIVDFVAEEAGPERADRVLSDILLAVERLSDRPRLGHLRTDLTDDDVLFWSVRGFLIVYRAEKPLEIVRVISGRRDIATLFRRASFET